MVSNPVNELEIVLNFSLKIIQRGCSNNNQSIKNNEVPQQKTVEEKSSSNLHFFAQIVYPKSEICREPSMLQTVSTC